MWSLPDFPDAIPAQDDGRYLSLSNYGVPALETMIEHQFIVEFDSAIARVAATTSLVVAAQRQAFVAIDHVQAITQTLQSVGEALRVAEPMSFLTAALEQVTQFTDLLSNVNRFAVPGHLTLSWLDWLESAEIERISFGLDLSLSQNAEVESDNRVAALDRMVDRFLWVRKRPLVPQALARRACESGISQTDIFRGEVRSAILLALGTSTHPQVIRFGFRWVRDDQGKIIDVVPDQLEDGWYLKWFRNTVARMVVHSLLEIPDRVPTRRSRSLKEPKIDVGLPLGWEDLCPAPPEDDPLVLLTERDEQEEIGRQLVTCLTLATPRQHAILCLLDQGMSTQEVARHLGIAESTVRVQLHQLRKRVQASDLTA